MVKTGVFQVKDKEQYTDIAECSNSSPPDEVRVLSVRDESVRVIEIWNSVDSPPNPNGLSKQIVNQLQQEHIIKKDRSLS